MTHTDDTQQATAHTPEPWTYNDMAIVGDERGTVLADCEIIPPAGGTISPPDEEVANARRIVAAVNACQGIPTDALEQGVVRELLQALEEIYNWFTPDWQQSSLGNKARAAIVAATGRTA